MAHVHELQVFMNAFILALQERFDTCNDGAETPCDILRSVLNAACDARAEVNDNAPHR